MDVVNEEKTDLAKRQDTFLERVNRIPQMLDDWETSFMDRLDQAKNIDPIDKNFAVMNFHRNQLVVLGQYSAKAMIRTIGAVGATKSFETSENGGIGVSFKPEVEFFPEKIAGDNLNKITKEKSEKFDDEFDEFVVVYLDQVGKRLNPPINLTEMVIKQVLDRVDVRVDASQLVDIRNVITNLDLPKDQQDKGYPMNEREKEVYDLLLPLTSEEPVTYDPGLKPTRLSYSVGSALKYVWNKSAYYFLQDQQSTNGGQETKRELSAPNALEASILQMYENSSLSPDSAYRRKYPKENLEWYLNSIGGELSFAPGNLVKFYCDEKFKNGELTKLYDYPGLDNFL